MRRLFFLSACIAAGAFSGTPNANAQGLFDETELIGPDGGSQPDDAVSESLEKKLLVDDAAALFAKPTRALVSEVLDGDTIKLSTGQVLRYLGVDAPETFLPKKGVTDFYGKAAREFNEALVLNKFVDIEYDVKSHDSSKPPRVLAYVRQDGKFINDLLVRSGQALAAVFPPNTKYASQFACSQKAAIAEKKGLWGLSADEIRAKYGRIQPPAAGETRQEQSVVIDAEDGDTVFIEGPSGPEDPQLLRLIGIDAPESKVAKIGADYYGKESAEFLGKLLRGKKVRIEYDVTYRDRYDRILAYIWMGDTLINAELVRLGWAFVATFPPDVKYIDRLIAAQNEAQTKRVGLWKSLSNASCN